MKFSIGSCLAASLLTASPLLAQEEAKSKPSSPPKKAASADASVSLSAGSSGSKSKASAGSDVKATKKVEAAKAPPTKAPPTAAKKELAKPAEGPAPSAGTLWYWPETDRDRVEFTKEDEGPSERGTFALGVVYDVHGFVRGPVDGVAQEVRAVFGTHAIGIAAGVYFPDARISLGLDIGRHWSPPSRHQAGDYEIAYLLPTVEPRALISTRGETTVFALGSALAGIQISRWPFALDLRLPRFDVWVDSLDLTNANTNIALSVGLSLGGAYAF